ncbi:phosphonate ABC transporter, permease protein PhnE [Spelaeicoccus albus]|uniref:Phosphonate transport system permease protein n=1 Tax=Spelaeicoccus albus TaxID=1280376 RepID=A0A7Z0CZ37_9MICO|nr:phosphonate ABC transporter, permease protein PhnE [Spelaeicoccus albus]NYI65874.1 phosphonate transport system permease protein [Spelaeicoccus albus]
MSAVTRQAPQAAPPGPAGPGRRPRRVAAKIVWLVITALVVAAVWSVDIKWSELADFPANLWKYLTLMFGPPDLGKLPEAFSATILSVQMAWLGTVIGIIVSFPLSFLAARGVAPAAVRWPMRGLFALIRAVPEVVIAVLILSVTGLTAFTGALALAVGSIGTLGKWGYESFESIDSGPLEATASVGGSPVAQMRWGVWPQAQPEVFAFWLYRFEINVRASAILGLIGAGGIGKMLTDNVQYRIWDGVGMLLIVVIVVTMAIDQLSGMVRHRIIDGTWKLPLLGRRSPTPEAKDTMVVSDND